MLTPEVPTPALSGVYRYRCLVRCLPPALSLPPSLLLLLLNTVYSQVICTYPMSLFFLVLLVSAEDYGLYKYHSRCVVKYYRIQSVFCMRSRLYFFIASLKEVRHIPVHTNLLILMP